MKILLELCYDGSGFHGYQVQPGKVTVQSALQDAIEAVYGERYLVKGCSRTDSGVHALSYFATYDTEKDIPTDRIPAALNSVLDRHIAVKSARIVKDDFHVRHDVKLKEYEYLIMTGEIPDPFMRGRCWHYPKKLGENAISLMREAALRIVGKRDFSSFMSAGSSVEDTVRDVKYIEITGKDELISIRVAADGFLYNMVRIIVGTLIDVAAGRILPEEISGIIQGGNRSDAGMTAPPEGLYLRKVEFFSETDVL